VGQGLFVHSPSARNFVAMRRDDGVVPGFDSCGAAKVGGPLFVVGFDVGLSRGGGGQGRRGGGWGRRRRVILELRWREVGSEGTNLPPFGFTNVTKRARRRGGHFGVCAVTSCGEVHVGT
jgi:hypothetical protein